MIQPTPIFARMVPRFAGRRQARSGCEGGFQLHWLVYAGWCALSLLPFLAVRHPPIVDFANHAARLSLACARNDPDVLAMFRYELGIIPNLAADLINLPLCAILTPGAVLTGITVAALAILYFAAWSIQKTLFGTPSWLLLLVPSLSINLVTTMGYTNYLVGIAIMAAMVALAVRSGSRRILLVIGNIGGILLFFSHIFSLVLALIFFFGWQVRPAEPGLRPIAQAALRTLAMFLAPLLLIPFVAQGSSGQNIDYSTKGRMVVAPFLSHHPLVDLGLGLALASTLYLLVRTGRASVAPQFRLPLILIGVCALLIPSQVQRAVDVDSRMMVPLAFLLLTAMAPSARSSLTRFCAILFAALLMGSHLASIVTTARPFDRQAAELREAMTILPARSAVFSVVDEPKDRPSRKTAAYVFYSNMTSYGTIDRRIFNPIEFTGIGMQPLAAVGRYSAIDSPTSHPIPRADALKAASPTAEMARRAQEGKVDFVLNWPSRFDYVLYYHFGAPPNFDPGRLKLVHSGSFFSILETPARRKRQASEADRSR